MGERKILIEVTKEELEKINSGALNKEVAKDLSKYSTGELIKEIIDRTPEESKTKIADEVPRRLDTPWDTGPGPVRMIRGVIVTKDIRYDYNFTDRTLEWR